MLAFFVENPLSGKLSVVAATRIVAAAACLVISSVGRAQGRPHSLTVIVTDSANGNALDGAQVLIRRASLFAVTKSNGILRFQLAAPTIDTIEVRRLGFRPLAASLVMGAGDSTEVVFELEAIPGELPPVLVTAPALEALTRAGFYDRRQRYKGTFFDPADIKRLGPSRVTDIMVHVPGVRLPPGPGGSRRVRFRRASICRPLVYLDGVSVSTDVQIRGLTGRRPDRGIDDFPVDDLIGVEVYPAATQIPPEFNMSGSICGVIVLWTGARERVPQRP